MKEVAVTFWELDEEDVKSLPPKSQVLEYDTLTGRIRVTTLGGVRKIRERWCKYLLHRSPLEGGTG